MSYFGFLAVCFGFPSLLFVSLYFFANKCKTKSNKRLINATPSANWRYGQKNSKNINNKKVEYMANIILKKSNTWQTNKCQINATCSAKWSADIWGTTRGLGRAGAIKVKFFFLEMFHPFLHPQKLLCIINFYLLWHWKWLCKIVKRKP